MLDAPVRRWIDPSLDSVAIRLAKFGTTADALTVAALALGLLAFGSIISRHYIVGLVLFAGNRALDGLDGAVARRNSPTDLGAYLDIVFDFIIYALLPLGFAMADASRGTAAAFLIVSFVSTGTTFLAFAIFAAKRGLSTELRGQKSFYHLGGLTEGTETFLAFSFMCVFPQAFAPIAYVFGTLCFITAGSRVATAISELRSP
jgi:phosphatidylglycerophosphate synthase